MSPTDSVQPDTIFAPVFMPRPDTIRTYSHRTGSNIDARSLPQLKPTPPTRDRSKLNKTNGSLFSPPGGTLVSDDHDPNPQDLNPPRALVANTREPEQEIREHDVPTHAVENYEIVYNPEDPDMESQQDSRDVRPATEISDTESDPDTSDDGVEHLSRRNTRPKNAPNKPTSRAPVPAPSRARSIRRQPFLIFDKTPKKPTSFKKLKQKHDATKTSYLPGDGFSDSEARPKGLFQLTKKRKLHFSVPAVGILDLTQAPAPSPSVKPSSANQPKEPRIILKRKKRVRDNSFLPPTPKKVRRERRDENDKQKKPDTQPTVISDLSAPYGQVASSIILGESPNDERVASLPPNVEETTETENINCTKKYTVEPPLPSPVNVNDQVVNDTVEPSLRPSVNVNDRVVKDTVEPSLPPPVNVNDQVVNNTIEPSLPLSVNVKGRVVENDIICVAFSDLPFNFKKEINSSRDNGYVPETSPPMLTSLQPNPPTVDGQAEGAVQPS